MQDFNIQHIYLLTRFDKSALLLDCYPLEYGELSAFAGVVLQVPTLACVVQRLCFFVPDKASFSCPLAALTCEDRDNKSS
jgi:hypothetical protein